MLKVGDLVTWSSQSGGFATEKRGRVVMVVPAGRNTALALANNPELHRMGRTFANSYPRDHESYLVAVRSGKTEKSAEVLYWPRAKGLRKLEVPA